MKRTLTFIWMLTSLLAGAQPGSMVFNDTILHSVYVETGLPDWFATLEQDFKNNFSNPEVYPEIYRKCKVTFDGVVLNDCGFREKGNASNTLTNFGKKKHFKLSFNEFIDQQLDGLKKINLNNSINDPAMMHNVASYKLCRDAGLAAPRTSYCTLHVDGEYIGVFVIIENVDKTFLKMHYGGANNDGNLYKTDRGAAVYMNWLGADKQAYKDKGLKLNTNEIQDDWSKLINFLDFLNNYTGPDFREQLEQRFDVHAYLKALAVEKCVRSWDSYWGGGNNFYIYEHPDGKYRWIPWDMNETFQDIKMLSGTSLLDGYLIPTPQLDERPLLRRIFSIEDYKNEYLYNCCELVQTTFTLDHLGPFILDRHNLIDEAYRLDPHKTNSYESFKKSLTEHHSDEVSITHSGYVLRLTYPGIYPFIQSQREWVAEQLQGWDKECAITNTQVYDLHVFPLPAAGVVNVSNKQTGFEYARFKLYDFTGKLCYESDYQVMEGSYTTLQLETLPAGIYLLLKQSADGMIGRSRIIIN